MTPGRWLFFIIAFAAIGAALLIVGDAYYLKFATRILIYGIAAVALDLVVGFGGLISFGHAAFFGIGAYVAGILAQAGIQSAILVWPAAMVVAGVIAALIGALSLRTSGIYFIFATLAFAQMLFYVAQSLRTYGGDDGFALAEPTRFLFDVTSENPSAMFIVTLALCAAFLLFCVRLVASPFGQVVQGARDNRRRIAAVGFNAYPYQVVLFAISGAGAGLAGALNAALTSYISPSSMSWVASGDLLMMVILGSAGTLVGPLFGAAIFIFFEQVLSDLTPHWMLFLGPLLVARVILLREGIVRPLLRRLALRTAS